MVCVAIREPARDGSADEQFNGGGHIDDHFYPARNCGGALASESGTPRSRRHERVLYLPVIIPDIIMGLSLLVLFSQLNMPLGKTTVIIAHITFSLSYVYVVVTARLSGMGKQLDEAAQDLGATPWQTFRHVTLPQIAPALSPAP